MAQYASCNVNIPVAGKHGDCRKCLGWCWYGGRLARSKAKRSQAKLAKTKFRPGCKHLPGNKREDCRLPRFDISRAPQTMMTGGGGLDGLTMDASGPPKTNVRSV